MRTLSFVFLILVFFPPSPPGCYGNLGNITPNKMGCVSKPVGGPESGLLSPPQVKSNHCQDS